MSQTMMLPLQTRGAEICVDSFDEATNSIELVWTTGAAVQRYSYRDGPFIEELVVSPKAVRLGRLNAGAPFLNTHSSYDLSQVIGAVQDGTAKLDGGRGLCRMGLSVDPAHAGIVGNIKAKIIRNVSVGYLIHAVEKSERDDGKPAVWRVTDWEPIEVSAVPIPADPGSQIRSGHAGAGELHPCEVRKFGGRVNADIEVHRARLRMRALARGLIDPRFPPR